MSRIYNFSAGPAVLPEPVLEEAHKALWDLNGTGIGMLEHSHRGKAFDRRAARDVDADCREARRASPTTTGCCSCKAGRRAVLHGADELARPRIDTADYLVTGAWAEKAVKEAKRYGSVHERLLQRRTSNFSTSRKTAKYSAAPRVRPLHVEQHDLRHAVPDGADAAGRRAADLRRQQRHLQPADRRRRSTP